MRIPFAVRNRKLYISALNRWGLFSTEAVHRWVTQRWHWLHAMMDTVLSPFCSAILDPMSHALHCMLTTWLLPPQASHPCSRQKAGKSRLNFFSLWEALPLPKTMSTSHGLELCHVTTSNCKGSWEIEYFTIIVSTAEASKGEGDWKSRLV